MILFYAFPVQLSNQLSVKSFLPTFNFLGSLMDAAPDVAHSLVTQYGETLLTYNHSFTGTDKQQCVLLCMRFSCG